VKDLGFDSAEDAQWAINTPSGITKIRKRDFKEFD